MDDNAASIGTTEQPRSPHLALAPPDDIALPLANKLQNASLVDRVQDNINSLSTQHTSVDDPATMESKSRKRALSPTGLECKETDTATESASVAKRMKLTLIKPSSDPANCNCNFQHDRGLSIQSMGSSKSSRNPNWAEVILNVLKTRGSGTGFKVTSVLLNNAKGPCVIFLEMRGQACKVMREFSSFTFRGDDFSLSFWQKGDSTQQMANGNSTSTSTPTGRPNGISVGDKPKADAAKQELAKVETKLGDRWQHSRNKQLYQVLAEQLGFQLNVKLIPTPTDDLRNQMLLTWFDVLHSTCLPALTQVYQVVGTRLHPLRFFLVFDSVQRKADCRKLLLEAQTTTHVPPKTKATVEITDDPAAIGRKTSWMNVTLEELRLASSKLAADVAANPASKAEQLALNPALEANTTSKSHVPASNTAKPVPKASKAAHQASNIANPAPKPVNPASKTANPGYEVAKPAANGALEASKAVSKAAKRASKAGNVAPQTANSASIVAPLAANPAPKAKQPVSNLASKAGLAFDPLMKVEQMDRDPTLEDRQPTKLSSLLIEDVELQTRYFGSMDWADHARCYCCAKAGHLPEECPQRRCGHCGKVNVHFSIACPTHLRCSNCHEVGHTNADCTSKLKRSMAADGIVCLRCNADDHGEESCPMLWTTYEPQIRPDRVPLVPSIRRFCYQCGSDKHWGSDCVFKRSNRHTPRGPFSSEYASHFLPADGDAEMREPNSEACEGFAIVGMGRVERQSHAPTHVNRPTAAPSASQHAMPPSNGYVGSPLQVGVSGPQYSWAYSMAPASMPYRAPVRHAPALRPWNETPHLPPLWQPLSRPLYYYDSRAVPQQGYQQGWEQVQPPLPNEPPPPFYEQGPSQPPLPDGPPPPPVFSFVDSKQ